MPSAPAPPDERGGRPPADVRGARPQAAPEEASLREAALRHLARYATTEAGLLRVLHRRIDRWARQATDGSGEDVAAAVATAREIAGSVVAALARDGAVDDTSFAAARARNLTRAGRSQRAVAAHLAAKGVDGTTAREAMADDPEAELAAALTLARKRRIGPFRAEGLTDAAAHAKELAKLARAGFVHAVATRALAMTPEEAEERILAFRR